MDLNVQTRSSKSVTANLLRPQILNLSKRESDYVRQRADKVYGRTFTFAPNGPLYDSFFCVDNFSHLIRTLETEFGVILNPSNREDVMVAMLQCFAYHGSNLDNTNRLVVIRMQPKVQALTQMKQRYQQNLSDNESNKFLHFMDPPRQIRSDRRDVTLSFSDALFGVNDRNARAFDHFKLK
jgi:hypothetical protein